MWTDRRTDMTKLIVAFSSFAKGPNKSYDLSVIHTFCRFVCDADSSSFFTVTGLWYWVANLYRCCNWRVFMLKRKCKNLRRCPFSTGTMFFAVYSTITNVWIALWKRIWNKTLFQYLSKFNCHQTFVSFLYQQHYFTVQSVRSEHKTTKVIICTYWWWLVVNYRTRNRTRQTDTSPQYAVRCEQETQKYSNASFVNPMWAGLSWMPRKQRQCQIKFALRA
jgi:hypothetical protein